MAHQAGQQWLDAAAAAVDNTSDAPVDTSDAIAAAVDAQSGAEPSVASPVVRAPPDTTIEERNRKRSNKLKLRPSIVGVSPSVGTAPGPVTHAAAATVHSATLVHNIGGIDKGAMGAADYPVGGHDDLANVLQSPADSPPQPHACRQSRAAEIHSRIQQAQAKVAQLRKELNDLRSHKADHREAILAGKPPPTDVATAAAAPAPHVRGSIVAENKRIQAEKAAKAAGVGQDRL